MRRRIRRRQADEFDTPWPVPAEDVCISFIHIPSLFDEGRSQRIFNLINKDVAFAPLVEHPLVLSVLEQELGRDLVVLDMSVNSVGAATNSPGGWHIDSPLTHVPEPLPNLTLSIQTAWMLDDFTADNGATHVVAGSNHTQRKPPPGRRPLDGEVVLEGRAGSVAMWLSQTWHRHGANVSDAPAPRADRAVRALVDQAVRRPPHADRRRAGGRVLAPTPLPARLQRQRARAGLITGVARTNSAVRVAASPVGWGVDFADRADQPAVAGRPRRHRRRPGSTPSSSAPSATCRRTPTTLRDALASRGAHVGRARSCSTTSTTRPSRDACWPSPSGSVAFVAAAGGGVFVVIDKPDEIRVATAGRSDAAPRLDDDRWRQMIERFDEIAAIAR